MRFLIVDDHDVVREGVAAVLRRRDDVEELLFAKDRHGLTAALNTHADVALVLLDLMLPGEGGFSLMRYISENWPDIPVLILSSSEDPADVRTALGRGALGYVPKSAASSTLLNAVEMVMNGDIYVPPFALGRLDKRQALEPLTARQAEILALVSENLSNKAIALKFDLSEKTVKAHLTAIYRALDVTTRDQAIAAAKRRQAG